MNTKFDLRAVIITACAVVTVVVIAVFCLSKTPAPDSESSGIRESSVTVDTNATTDTVPEDENPLADRQIYFAGINDCVVDHESVICLENPTDNGDIFIAYSITDSKTGEVVYETDLIPSGERILWVPSENLADGDYTLNFTQTPYWRINEDAEWQTLTNGNNTVNVTIVADGKPSK